MSKPTDEDFWANCPPPDMSKPSLQALAKLLDEEASWRNKDFEWFFPIWLAKRGTEEAAGFGNFIFGEGVSEKCGTAGCAIGLAAHAWTEDIYGLATTQIRKEMACILHKRLDLKGDNLQPHIDKAWEAIFQKGDFSTSPAEVSGRIKDFLRGDPIR